MKTLNNKTAKEIRTALLLAIFSLAIFTTVRIKELQVNEKSSEINTLVNQIEHEVPRRKRTDYAGLFSFRSKRRGISTVEISNKFIPKSMNPINLQMSISGRSNIQNSYTYYHNSL